jgi:cytochrome P450
MLVSDPPEHDRMRRQFMRHFGPPHTPDLIPSMGAMVEDLANSLLDKVAAVLARMDVVEDCSYPIRCR